VSNCNAQSEITAFRNAYYRYEMITTVRTSPFKVYSFVAQILYYILICMCMYKTNIQSIYIGKIPASKRAIILSPIVQKSRLCNKNQIYKYRVEDTS